MNLLGIFLVAAGIFSICGGVFNWDWYMNLRKARTMVNMIGRTGARVFYVILGLVVAVMGVLMMAGVIESTY